MASSNAPECRTHVEGMEVTSGFVLPSIAVAREEAKRIDEVIKDTVPSAIVNDKGKQVLVCEPLQWNVQLPNLFKFSFFVEEQDMPEDLLEPAIWALQTLKRVWEEARDVELLAVKHLLPHQTGELAKNARKIFLLNIGSKLGVYHLHPKINKPEVSLKIFEERLKEQSKLLAEPWVEDPFLHYWLGESLVRTGGRANCERAKTVLKQLLSSPKLNLATTVSGRALLARALRALNEDAAAETEEAWLVKWHRKNPFMIANKDLRMELLNADGSPTPVLEGLGGLDWLKNRRRTDKTDDRWVKQCRHCRKREPAVKLSRCARCQYMWYCSKECQKANWPYHKPSCNELAEELRKIEKLALVDTVAAQRAADWAEFKTSSHDANNHILIHALGLHKDRTRGRTHIVFKYLAWNPKSKTVRSKFRITACGVYKISDVLPEIEAALNINKGEGLEYIDGLLASIDLSKEPLIPILSLSFGDDIATWLGSSAINESGLRSLEYNPNWRDVLNIKGDPPAKLQLKRTTLKDAEHDF